MTFCPMEPLPVQGTPWTPTGCDSENPPQTSVFCSLASPEVTWNQICNKIAKTPISFITKYAFDKTFQVSFATIWLSHNLFMIFHQHLLYSLTSTKFMMIIAFSKPGRPTSKICHSSFTWVMYSITSLRLEIYYHGTMVGHWEHATKLTCHRVDNTAHATKLTCHRKV